jgi:hypothetical protein
MGWGGRREGAGRPKGLHGVKSTELAEMLDDMGANPAKALARLGLKAEREGNDDLATRAYAALLPFRYAKLRETSLGIGLLEGSGSLADKLEAASARLTISVVTGVPRPPDDFPDAIDPDPVPPPSPASPPPEPPAPQPSPSPPKPRPNSGNFTGNPPPPPSAPDPPAPPRAPGRPVPAHEYWTQRKPEVPSAGNDTDYDPWKT